MNTFSIRRKPRSKQWSCKQWSSLVTLAIAICCAEIAGAQVLPTQQNPGLLNTEQPGEVLPTKAVSETRLMDEVRLELPEHVGADRVEAPGLMVQKIEVQGSTLLKPEDWQALMKPYEGREQSLAELNKAADTLTAWYHERGYLTAQAFIPPQDIENGIVRIEVREGVIGEIGIEGNKAYQARLIERSLSQAPGSLFNVRVLERELNRSNRQHEGYRLKAVLKAGNQPGETNLKIQVAERFPVQVSPTFDNQGRPFIGMNRGGIELRNESLSGYGDRLSVRVLAGTGTRILTGSYYVPINKWGTEIGANYAYSAVDLDLNIENQPALLGKAHNYGLGLVQPLNAERTWVADVGVNWRSVRSYFEDEITDDSQVRSLEAGLNFSKFDRWGRTFNRVQGTLGVGTLGANAKFFKLENYFTRIATLPKRNLLIVRGYGQLTPDALPAVEQFQIGGAFSVRGFTEGVLIGDRGFSASLEHRFPVPGVRFVSPWLDERLQGAWFYDVGRVWTDRSNRTFVAGLSDTTQRTLLQSVGVGVRMQLTRFLQGFVDVGFGLGDRDKIEPLEQPVARLHFGIRSDLMAGDYAMRSRHLNAAFAKQVSAKP